MWSKGHYKYVIMKGESRYILVDGIFEQKRNHGDTIVSMKDPNIRM